MNTDRFKQLLESSLGDVRPLINEQTVDNGRFADELSNKVRNLFLPTSKFWVNYKGSLNDDEEGAAEAFDSWWNTNVQPHISKFSGPNSKSLNTAYKQIREALLGDTSNDTVRWIIQTIDTGGKRNQNEYEVNTDF